MSRHNSTKLSSPFPRAVTYCMLRDDGLTNLLQQEKSKISRESNLELSPYILSSSGAIFVIRVSEEEWSKRRLTYLHLKHCSPYFKSTILLKTLKIMPGSSRKWSLGICKWAIHNHGSSWVTEKSAAWTVFDVTDKESELLCEAYR